MCWQDTFLIFPLPLSDSGSLKSPPNPIPLQLDCFAVYFRAWEGGPSGSSGERRAPSMHRSSMARLWVAGSRVSFLQQADQEGPFALMRGEFNHHGLFRLFTLCTDCQLWWPTAMIVFLMWTVVLQELVKEPPTTQTKPPPDGNEFSPWALIEPTAYRQKAVSCNQSPESHAHWCRVGHHEFWAVGNFVFN